MPDDVESDVLDSEEPDHCLVDSSDDEDSFEEDNVESSVDDSDFEDEPATLKGQDDDRFRADGASRELAGPTAMGDED